MNISTTDFDIVYENERFLISAQFSETEVINSVDSSFPHIGVSVTFSPSEVTISGRYHNMYSPATWRYIPVDSTDIVTISNFDLMPAKIGTIISGEKEEGSTVLVTYSVNTTETTKTYTTETGYNSVTDPDTEEVTQVPYTYQQEHINQIDHSYTITQQVSNIWDDVATQLSLAVSRSEY